jgi:hypothetical protein
MGEEIMDFQSLILVSAVAYLSYGAALLINDRNNRK